MADNEQAGSPESDSSLSISDRIANAFLGPEEKPETDPTPDAPGPDETADVEAAASDEGEQPEATAPDVEEVEWQGERFQVPAKLKEAVIQASDYTKKTQELAEARRIADFEVKKSKAVQSERVFADSVKEELSSLAEIDTQLARYKSVDVSSIDPSQLPVIQWELGKLRESKEETQRKLDAKYREFQQGQERAIQELQREGQEVIRKNIQNFNKDTATEIAERMRAIGYSDDEIGTSLDPRVFILAHEAAQYRKLKAQTATTAPKVAQAKPIGKATTGRPMDQAARDRIAYSKAMSSAKTSTEKARIIQERLARTF